MARRLLCSRGMTNLLDSLRARALRAADDLAWLPPLLARLTVGIVFLFSGWGKLHDLDNVTTFFTDLGIPAPGASAVVVSIVELAGGALLILGLASRLAALPLAGTMVVAILTARRDEIVDVQSLFAFVEVAYIALLAWIAVAGPGAVSLDHVIKSRRPQPTQMQGEMP
jgi:putative oxidoreductase